MCEGKGWNCSFYELRGFVCIVVCSLMIGGMLYIGLVDRSCRVERCL